MSITVNQNEQLEAAIRTFIAENFIFGPQSRQLASDQSLLDSGVIDSTGVLELITFLEETYELEIPDNDIIPENLDSVARIAQYISRKRGGVT